MLRFARRPHCSSIELLRKGIGSLAVPMVSAISLDLSSQNYSLTARPRGLEHSREHVFRTAMLAGLR